MPALNFETLEKGRHEYQFRAGKYLKKVILWKEGTNIFFKFGFNRTLMDHIKSLAGAKWHGYDELKPRKLWSVKDCSHNRFQLRYLNGENPYSPYDAPMPHIVEHPGRVPMFDHQKEMLQHALRGKQVIFAVEMGGGKSRVFIELIERVPALAHQIWYVGPKAGVRAVSREFRKWKCDIQPVMMTYEGMVKALDEWVPGTPPPKIVCFDESSKIKTPSAQRSQAAFYLAEQMRDFWGQDGCYILEMSGTPAPKTPVDWWHQCEVAQPGFLKEGTLGKFKARLCIIEMRESIQGAKYPHIVSWLDDESKCAHCGRTRKQHPNHLWEADLPGQPCKYAGCGLLKVDHMIDHSFTPSINEVHNLYERMRGLVIVKFKKDCLDLPEKQYRQIQVKPTLETLRAARLVRKRATRAVTALMLLRELSDGFQYTEVQVGEEACPNCDGKGVAEEPVPLVAPDNMKPQDIRPENFERRTVQCRLCEGKGKVPKMERQAERVACPKDDIFIELLDEHEDVGRFIAWGGFTETVDRLTEIAMKQGWYVLRVDGRGNHGFDPLGNSVDPDVLLDCMDGSSEDKADLRQTYDRVCWVGQPGAGGTAYTLTAAPTMLYYSNTFKGEDRMQSEDRHHRPGMDVNRGATIVDVIHLPSDLVVLRSLKQKKRLQDMTMGQLEEAFNNDSD